MATQTYQAIRYIRLPAVLGVTGMSRSTVYLLMQKGEFPRPVKLTSRSVAWPESAITDWLASRPVSA